MDYYMVMVMDGKRVGLTSEGATAKYHENKKDFPAQWHVLSLDEKVHLPSLKVIENLGKKYLGSPIRTESAAPKSIYVYAKAGFSRERKAAFLGAITARATLQT